jgi:hypothetical protein
MPWEQGWYVQNLQNRYILREIVLQLIGQQREELLRDQTPDGTFKKPFSTADAKTGA